MSPLYSGASARFVHRLLVQAVSPKLLSYQFTSGSSIMARKTALLVCVDGMEEMEAVITADVLRRAEIDVTLAGATSSNPVKCSRSIVIVPDKSLTDIKADSFDAIILPGGLGAAKFFSASAEIGGLLKSYEAAGKLIAIICASPIALAAHEIGLGKTVTSYPAMADQLKSKYKYTENRVAVDGQLITSRAPGTAFEFALAIVKNLVGDKKVAEVSGPMLLK